MCSLAPYWCSLNRFNIRLPWQSLHHFSLHHPCNPKEPLGIMAFPTCEGPTHAKLFWSSSIMADAIDTILQWYTSNKQIKQLVSHVWPKNSDERHWGDPDRLMKVRQVEERPLERISQCLRRDSKPTSHEHVQYIPSGKQPHSYWKWPFIVDLPIENGDFP